MRAHSSCQLHKKCLAQIRTLPALGIGHHIALIKNLPIFVRDVRAALAHASDTRICHFSTLSADGFALFGGQGLQKVVKIAKGLLGVTLIIVP